jgi:hypothetical protein
MAVEFTLEYQRMLVKALTMFMEHVILLFLMMIKRDLGWSQND